MKKVKNLYFSVLIIYIFKKSTILVNCFIKNIVFEINYFILSLFLKFIFIVKIFFIYNY